jgi:O-antigen/teichoic acid export membrane protein
LFHKIRDLFRNLAIYGVGEVAIQIVNFLLLPLYTKYLTPGDYGILALLASLEAPIKLFFRWGVDGAFMRFWYDCEDERARQRLSSTLFFFLLTVNGLLLVVALAAGPFLADRFLHAPEYTRALRIVLVNTFAIGFTFIPFHVLRIEKRAREFSTLTLARSVSTLALRILLIVGMERGVMGVVYADIIVTAGLTVVMARWYAPLLRPLFSARMLRESLAFGLPRVPHGFALQVMSVGDRWVMAHWQCEPPKPCGDSFVITRADIGMYSMGVSFGLIPKIALGAFEYAWAPFYYAAAREPGAERLFAGVTTYGVAALALMTAGLAAIARDLLTVATHGQYTSADGIVTWTAVGVFFYGVYLLTSIGLNITKHTQYYPLSTAVGAAANIGLCFLLIPRVGIIGAAWANGAAYAAQALIAWRLSRRFYPIDYEWGRLARAVGAAAIGYLAARALPAMPPLAGLLARGTTVLLVVGALLLMTSFLNTDELRAIDALRRRGQGTPVRPPTETTEMAGEIVALDVPEPDAPRDNP